MFFRPLRIFSVLCILSISSVCSAELVSYQYVAEVNFDPTGTYPLGQRIDIFVDYDPSVPDEGNNPVPENELSYELLNTIFIIDGNVIAYVRPVMNVWGAAAVGCRRLPDR